MTAVLPISGGEVKSGAAPKIQTDECIELVLESEAGQTFVLEASPDLWDWEEITIQTSLDGVVRFRDCPGSATRFYRVRQE